MTRVKLAELTGVVFSPFTGELEGVRPLLSFTLQSYKIIPNYASKLAIIFTQDVSFSWGIFALVFGLLGATKKRQLLIDEWLPCCLLTSRLRLRLTSTFRLLHEQFSGFAIGCFLYDNSPIAGGDGLSA